MQAVSEHSESLHTKYVTDEKDSLFGSYAALSPEASMATGEELEAIDKAVRHGKSTALAKVAILPVIMFGCYIGLILYFRSRGGYQPVRLE